MSASQSGAKSSGSTADRLVDAAQLVVALHEVRVGLDGQRADRLEDLLGRERRDVDSLPGMSSNAARV
jgi:hypothetical protein